MPGKWCVDDWKQNIKCKNLNMDYCPFGVDTEKFDEYLPIELRTNVFIYYKTRNPKELNFIENILKRKNINYKIFNYDQRYNEEEYIDYLKYSKYGIWIGRHESQGFALEEALSCNVPLFVWDVKSMNQEYRQDYPDIFATVIPYWDERCGEYFYFKEEFEEKFDIFLSKLNNYNPRNFVLENLSISICEDKFLNIMKKFIALNANDMK
jgi:glycosyltransferase involved in cell wall biosynthesis